MKRERRYFVIKIKDAYKYLSTNQIANLIEIINDIDEGRKKEGRPIFNCVCVESDWPEYEPVWKMIESRVNFQQQITNENQLNLDL